jgi:hypothetical protein
VAGFGTLRIYFANPCPTGHITADKRLRFTSPKLPSATFFIRKTLCEIPHFNNTLTGGRNERNPGKKIL